MASLEPQARLCCGLLPGGGEGDLRGCAVTVALQPVVGHGARWRGLLLPGALSQMWQVPAGLPSVRLLCQVRDVTMENT